jgi:hypothetical protein
VCHTWQVDLDELGAFIAEIPRSTPLETATLRVLEHWQAGRCAACGEPGRPLVIDYDPASVAQATRPTLTEGAASDRVAIQNLPVFLDPGHAISSRDRRTNRTRGPHERIGTTVPG